MAEVMQKKLDNCAPRMQASAALDSASFAISEIRQETGLNRRIGDLFQEIFAGYDDELVAGLTRNFKENQGVATVEEAIDLEPSDAELSAEGMKAGHIKRYRKALKEAQEAQQTALGAYTRAPIPTASGSGSGRAVLDRMLRSAVGQSASPNAIGEKEIESGPNDLKAAGLKVKKDEEAAPIHEKSSRLKAAELTALEAGQASSVETEKERRVQQQQGSKDNELLKQSSVWNSADSSGKRLLDLQAQLKLDRQHSLRESQQRELLEQQRRQSIENRQARRRECESLQEAKESAKRAIAMRHLRQIAEREERALLADMEAERRRNEWTCCHKQGVLNEGCAFKHPGKFDVFKEGFGILTKKKWRCCSSREENAAGCTRHHPGLHPVVRPTEWEADYPRRRSLATAAALSAKNWDLQQSFTDKTTSSSSSPAAATTASATASARAREKSPRLNSSGHCSRWLLNRCLRVVSRGSHVSGARTIPSVTGTGTTMENNAAEKMQFQWELYELEERHKKTQELYSQILQSARRYSGRSEGEMDQAPVEYFSLPKEADNAAATAVSSSEIAIAFSWPFDYIVSNSQRCLMPGPTHSEDDLVLNTQYNEDDDTAFFSGVNPAIYLDHSSGKRSDSCATATDSSKSSASATDSSKSSASASVMPAAAATEALSPPHKPPRMLFQELFGLSDYFLAAITPMRETIVGLSAVENNVASPEVSSRHRVAFSRPTAAAATFSTAGTPDSTSASLTRAALAQRDTVAAAEAIASRQQAVDYIFKQQHHKQQLQREVEDWFREIFNGSSEDFIVEMATKFKQELGIVQLEDVLDADDVDLSQGTLAGLGIKPQHIHRFLQGRAALVSQLGIDRD